MNTAPIPEPESNTDYCPESVSHRQEEVIIESIESVNSPDCTIRSSSYSGPNEDDTASVKWKKNLGYVMTGCYTYQEVCTKWETHR